jgi:cytoskeletal protein RodZ
MKTLLSLTLAFALGIIVTVTVIIPKLSGQDENPAQTEIQTVINEAVSATATDALAKRETAEPTEIPQEANQTAATTKTLGTAAEMEAAVEVKEEPKPTEKPEPAAKPETKQVSAPPVQADQYPKEFYIDGQKYAYLTAYAGRTGQKTLIADEDEPNATQIEFFDWENSEGRDIPGPFTGNGGTN